MVTVKAEYVIAQLKGEPDLFGEFTEVGDLRMLDVVDFEAGHGAGFGGEAQ